MDSESSITLKNRTDKHMAKQLNVPQLITRPPIQRKNCWNNKENSAFIDTMVRQWHCSPIFLIEKHDENEDEDDETIVHHIFDGAHKVEAAINFIGDKYALEKIDKISPLKPYEGKKFSELPQTLRNKILNYKFTLNYIDAETANDKDSLRILWERLNKAGKKLNDFELALPVIFDLVNIVLKPSLPLFLETAVFTKEESKRGEAEKLLQMILATSEMSLSEASWLREFTSKKDLVKRWQTKCLGEKMSEIRDTVEKNKERWIANLKKASLYMKCLSEHNCFVNEEGKTILEHAHRGTELIFLLGRLVYHFPKSEDFRRCAKELSQEVKEKYFMVVQRNDPGRNGNLQKRLLKEIDEVTGRYAAEKTPRLFSAEVIKQKLIEQQNICVWCNKKILPNQTSQGDHIIPFSAGGKTESNNCQVIHSICHTNKSNGLPKP
jgi:5-methylcytosine-specific restriction endonuclease McrA